MITVLYFSTLGVLRYHGATLAQQNFLLDDTYVPSSHRYLSTNIAVHATVQEGGQEVQKKAEKEL